MFLTRGRGTGEPVTWGRRECEPPGGTPGGHGRGTTRGRRPRAVSFAGRSDDRCDRREGRRGADHRARGGLGTGAGSAGLGPVVRLPLVADVPADEGVAARVGEFHRVPLGLGDPGCPACFNIAAVRYTTQVSGGVRGMDRPRACGTDPAFYHGRPVSDSANPVRIVGGWNSGDSSMPGSGTPVNSTHHLAVPSRRVASRHPRDRPIRPPTGRAASAHAEVPVSTRPGVAEPVRRHHRRRPVATVRGVRGGRPRPPW